ncbi:hypothetical protein O4H49_02255 [Kiloniella laminariae]|uniref:Transposase n=1 Tax=Kiloniella laminariae TaxID=454162 RepID=A0ABT4LHU6_9PROT|nr:hypothetical protein [Kiloniella laminariae]MCZ4279582.1 hypothetical protein [Kiloniella laminariae]
MKQALSAAGWQAVLAVRIFLRHFSELGPVAPERHPYRSGPGHFAGRKVLFQNQMFQTCASPVFTCLRKSHRTSDSLIGRLAIAVHRLFNILFKKVEFHNFSNNLKSIL